jgi:hypothetical protein
MHRESAKRRQTAPSKTSFAHPDVVTVAAAQKVDRPHQIDLVEFVGGAGLGSRPLLAGQQGSQANPWRGQPVALEDAFDRTFAGERANAQDLQLSQDGGCADQTVAGGRSGVGLESAADAEDGPLQFGRNVLSDVVIGPGQVIEAIGAGLQVATPPLVKPDLGAAECGADDLDGSAGEA